MKNIKYMLSIGLLALSTLGPVKAQNNIETILKDTINIDSDEFLEELINVKILENGENRVELYANDEDNNNEYDYIKIRKLAKSFNFVEVEEFHIHKKDIYYIDNLERYLPKEKLSKKGEVYPIFDQIYLKNKEMPEKLKRIIQDKEVIKFTSKNIEDFLRNEYKNCKNFEY